MNRTQESEILRLRKELIHQRELAADLQEELEEKTNLYIKAISERDAYKEKLVNSKESINRVDQIVQSQVNRALEKERKELEQLRSENQLLKQRIELFDQEKLQNQQREKMQQDKILALTQDLQFYARNVDMRECMSKIDQLRAERNAKDQEVVKLIQEINKKSNELESALAENRTLRKMANVPQNYGIDAEQIKFLDREKIDDYKKLIRVLQEDNYRLEEERAKLKHMLKQQSMLYKTDQPSQRFKNLTPEQLFKVDQYVLKLLAGDTEEPADFYKLKKENQILKAQLDILNTKGFDFAKAQIEAFLKELGLGDSGKFMEKIMSGNEELKKLLKDLMAKGINVNTTSISGTQQTQSYNDHGKFRPPIPHIGVGGDITQGYTYKYESHLDVLDKDGRAGLTDQTKYNVAFLQLQLMEMMEIIKRKDEDLLNKNNEVESLYRKVRDYLLVQDQLYKDFVKQEKDFTSKKTELEQQLRNTRDSLYEEQHKVKNLENVLQHLQKGDAQSIQNRLIELTKQNSLLDINLLRLTRKYQILAEQEEILRREYHNKEADLAEKDRFVAQRINMLKEWKARAIQQLKFLFSKLRMAVPLTEYQSIQSENDILKQKNADYIDRNCQLAEKVSKLETKVRENMEAEEKLKTLQEIKEDIENEYEVVRKRLESVDSNYRWENAVFNKIVATLKRYNVSPQQAFEEFDKNKDGKLTTDEFIQGLNLLKIQDLSQQEIDILMGSIDVDNDKTIRYREFVRKLSRHGVKSRTSEEQIVYLIAESLKRSGVQNLSKAFQIFDKENRGSLTREDFKDAFKSMKARIDEADIDKFIDHFWKDKKAGIDYQEFLRIFSRYSVKIDQNQRQDEYDRIPDNVIRLKKQIYMELNKVLQEAGLKLKNIFDKVDENNSDGLDYDEFKAMFQKMKIKITDKEVKDIFNSIDFDWNGTVSFPEFIADFNKTVETDIITLLNQEKERVEQNRALSSGGVDPMNAGRTGGYQYNTGSIGMQGKRSAESQLQTRVDILETREKQLVKKLETSMRILHHAQQSQLEVQHQYDDLEKRWNELTKQFHEDKQKIRELEDSLRQSIRKEEAEQIRQLNEHLRTEIVETKAAMITYKNMTEVISDQVRGLKLAMERRKDENENLINAVREISSQSEEQKRLGKLYYLVMLSRWQEAAVNKKYDMILTENRDLRKHLMNTEQLYQNKEYDHHEAENVIQSKLLEIEKLKRQIGDSKNIFLTLEKAEQLNNIIKEISDEKSELEEQHLIVSTRYKSCQLQVDEYLSKAEHAQQLVEVLQKSKPSEISDKIIEMSSRLQQIRLQEMRSTRESNEHKEKSIYLSRLLRSQTDQLLKLEEKAAEFESRMHKREEEFRRKDNERMTRFFNARFDDIQGAFNENPLSNRRPVGMAFRDSEHSMKSPGQNQKPSASEISMYQEPDYIRRQQSQSNLQNDSKFLEGKVKKLENELANALEKIRAQEGIINRFKDWQLADDYLDKDAVLREAIEKQRGKSNQVHEQESKEMAEAAAQMVKTLQEMLEQKNQQLRSKDEIIDKLRKQILQQREEDALEIARLNNQLSLAAGTTLSKLQEIVVKNENMPINKYAANRYDKLTREELSKALDEKDDVIQRQSSEIKGMNQSLNHLKEKNQQLNDRIMDLEYELGQEKQQVELKQKVKELDRVRKELKEKDKKNENLIKAIAELNERMQKYEVEKFDNHEDKKMAKISDDLKSKEHKEEMKQLKNKLAMMESSRNQRTEELKQAKVQLQEIKDREAKLILDKDELQKALAKERSALDIEKRRREKAEIQVNNLQGKINIGPGMGSSTGPSYEALLARNKELENDIIILQCQQKTVVVYNRESGTFEYIGEPIYLNHDREITDVDEFLASMRSWLKRNERLTLQRIFESMDKENFGELAESKFESAMLKVGIKLRAQEKRIVKDVLDPRNIGFIRYRAMVRELQGVPQLDFMIKEIIRIARLVEQRDLTERDFKNLIDPQHLETMNLTQLQESFKLVCNEQFQISNEEVEYLFKNVTKSLRTIGVTISIDRLTEKVFTAVDALLIEKTKEAIIRSMRRLEDLFSRHDSDRDQQLSYAELENLLLECQLAFKPNMLERLYLILDPARKTSRITMNTLRFFIGETSYSSVSVQRSYDYEPSLERPKLSEEITQEEITIVRSAARKILQVLGQSGSNSLQDRLTQRDQEKDGIIARDTVQKDLEEAKIQDLKQSELNLLMNYMDKQNKGYISISHFIEKMYSLVTETKYEAVVRQFAQTAHNQHINLKQDLNRFDTTRTGRIDKKSFQKFINSLSVSLSPDDINMLFQAGEKPEQRGFLDIPYFLDVLKEALKYKPNQFVPKQTTNAKHSMQKQNSAAFENWEAEKKYKKKLEALQQQIEESKKETQAAEKLAKHWQDMASRLEKEKVGLQGRLVDANAKPPKAAAQESFNMAQVENIQQLKDQVFFLQEENLKLERIIQVELKAEIGKLQKENELLTEQKRHLQDETKRLEYQINRYIGRNMDQIELREEGEFWREKKIQELEKEIASREDKEKDLHEQLFKVEEKVLDLKFQKETFDLQYGRLQKRITDLEQYKLASSKFSAVLKNKEDDEVRDIEDKSNALSSLTGANPSTSKKAQDSVKLRTKSSKSVAELEMLVESLKRVIEKQKVENEQLKKQVEAQERQKDKLKSEKQLRQKIESLEQEVHNYEMKDINMDEKDRTIKKLIEANRQLREDLKREGERYQLIENKYKDLLVKYNVLAKEHAKHTEMIFQMNTGANIHNYSNYLSGAQENSFKRDTKQERSSSKNKQNDYQYDRTFEDVF